MGRRSRKRGGTARAKPAKERREAAGASRRAGGRPPASRQRPPAPWGSFPLSELIILAGIGVIGWALVSGGSQAGERLAAGLVLASLGGGELALREHLAGFRSHSTLLAGVAAFVAVTAVALALGPVKVWALLVLGVGVFGAAFYALRELFKRRSGGLGFR